MSNITAAAYEDSLCIERWLFLFFGFVISFVGVDEGVYVILSDFHITISFSMFHFYYTMKYLSFYKIKIFYRETIYIN